MTITSRSIKDAGTQLRKRIRPWFSRLKRKPPKNLDQVFQEAHLDAFSEIDCLECGNCCKTTGPRLMNADIKRISSSLKISQSIFISSYLRIDEDGDYVMKSLPCPFLGSDNYCSIYEDRPTACRTYPHTDRRRQHQLLDLHSKNLDVCPAVQNVLDKLEASYIL